MGSNGAMEEPRCKERNRRASERDAAEVWVLCKRKSFSLKVAHEQQSLNSNQPSQMVVMVLTAVGGRITA